MGKAMIGKNGIATLAVAASLAFSVPAAAQEQPAQLNASDISGTATEWLHRLMSGLQRANHAAAQHESATMRCDQVAMDEAMAELVAVRDEFRRAAAGLRALGDVRMDRHGEPLPRSSDMNAHADLVQSMIRRREEDIARRDCSETRGRSTAAASTGPVPLPPDLAPLRIAYRQAGQGCDEAAFETARRHLVAALDRAIAASNDDAEIDRLRRERAEALSASIACEGILEEIQPSARAIRTQQSDGTPPPTSAPIGMGAGDEFNVANSLSIITVIDEQIALAEAAMAQGDCDAAQGHLHAASEQLDRTASLEAMRPADQARRTLLAPELVSRFRERIQRLRERCGSPPPTPAPMQVGQASNLEMPLEAADPAAIVSAGAFVNWLDIPRFDTGFQREAAPDAQERPAGSSGEDVTQVGGAIDASIPLGDDFWLGLGFGYAEGDATSLFHVPPGHPSGIVYRDLSPGGSSGISASSGVDGSIHSTSRAFSYNIGADFMPVRDIRFRGSSTRAVRAPNLLELFAPSRLSVSAFVEDQETRHVATLRGEGSVGTFDYFFQHDSVQQVNEVRAGIEIGAGLGLRSGPVFAEFFAAGGPYLRWSDGTFDDRYQANVGPATDRDFITGLTEEDEGVGFRGRAAASLGVQLSSNMAFSIDGQAQVRTQVGSIVNPISGDQVFFDGERVRLGTESVWAWRVGTTLTVRLP